MDFMQRMAQEMENSLISLVKKGDWLMVDYGARVKITEASLREFYESIDMGRVKTLVKERLEEHMADKILNSMASEIATDIKRVLSNRELREDIRSVVRSKLREFKEGD